MVILLLIYRMHGPLVCKVPALHLGALRPLDALDTLPWEVRNLGELRHRRHHYPRGCAVASVYDLRATNRPGKGDTLLSSRRRDKESFGKCNRPLARGTLLQL